MKDNTKATDIVVFNGAVRHELTAHDWQESGGLLILKGRAGEVVAIFQQWDGWCLKNNVSA